MNITQIPLYQKTKIQHHNYQQYLQLNKLDNIYSIQQFIQKYHHQFMYSHPSEFKINSTPQSISFNKYHHINFNQINLYQKIINLIKINQSQKKIFINHHFTQPTSQPHKQPLLYLNSFFNSSSKIHTPQKQSKQLSTSTHLHRQPHIKHTIHHQNYQTKFHKQTTRYTKCSKYASFKTQSARIQSHQQQRFRHNINRKSLHNNVKLSLSTNQPPSATTLQYNKQLHRSPSYLSKQFRKQSSLLNTSTSKQQQIQPLPKITAKSYLIYQITQQSSSKSNIINHLSHNSKVRTQVASLTKIMTCIIAIQLCQKYHLQPKTELIKIGKYQSSIGGTSANLQINDVYSLHDLLHGLMLPSGNDASLAIAVWGGKKLLQQKQRYRTEHPQKKKLKKQYYQRYIQQMNLKTIQLKMTKTTYANTHGLINLFNRSCAHDLALLSYYCMKNSYFQNIVSCLKYQNTIQVHKHSGDTTANSTIILNSNTKNTTPNQLQHPYKYAMSNTQQTFTSTPPTLSPPSFQISHRKIYWENTHKLLQKKPKQYIGIKTGLTSTAGSCLCSCIKTQCGKHLFIIVLNCRKLHQRFKQTELLKKWVYRKLGIKTTKPKQSGKQLDLHSQFSLQQNQNSICQFNDQSNDPSN